MTFPLVWLIFPLVSLIPVLKMVQLLPVWYFETTLCLQYHFAFCSSKNPICYLHSATCCHLPFCKLLPHFSSLVLIFASLTVSFPHNAILHASLKSGWKTVRDTTKGQWSVQTPEGLCCVLSMLILKCVLLCPSTTCSGAWYRSKQCTQTSSYCISEGAKVCLNLFFSTVFQIVVI